MSTGIVNPGKLNGCILWHDYRRLTALDYGPLGNVHPGTLAGDASLDASLGLVLGGTGYVNAADPSSLNFPALSFSFWVKGAAGLGTIVASRFVSVGNRIWYIENNTISGTGRLFVRMYANGTDIAQQRYTNVVVFDDALHHVGIVLQSSNPLVYVDGVLSALTIYTNTPGDLYAGSAAALNIGRSGGGGSNFVGSLRSFLIFNRVLTAAELLALYAAGI